MGGANHIEPAVYAKRWAVLVGLVLVVVIILAIALRSRPPALYWEGQPMENASHVLVDAQAAMQSVASADEGALSSGSRCYFSLANSSDHDVAPYLRCGPILFPWSSPSAPWLAYAISGTPITLENFAAASKMAVARARSFLGNHSATAFKLAGKTADSPNPRAKRATTNPVNEVARP